MRSPNFLKISSKTLVSSYNQWVTDFGHKKISEIYEKTASNASKPIDRARGGTGYRLFCILVFFPDPRCGVSQRKESMQNGSQALE